MMLKTLLASALLVATVSAQGFYYALDISNLGTTSAFSCLKSNGYSTAFIRCYKPDQGGTPDYNAVQNVNMAFSAGLGIEVFMTPAPSGKVAYSQVDDAIAGLTNGGVTIRTLWIQVTSPVNWNSNKNTNLAFITTAIQRIRARGITPGVYTNSYDWNQITGNAGNLGTDVMLWYWNVFGGGTGGESPANFQDFRAFGNWNRAAVKQFGQNEAICGFTANRDCYPTSSIKASTLLVNKMMFEKEKKIVAGGIGL